MPYEKEIIPEKLVRGNPLPGRQELEAFVRRKVITSGALGQAPSPSSVSSLILDIFEDTVIRDYDVPDSKTRAIFYKLETIGVLRRKTISTERQGKPWRMHHWILTLGGDSGVKREEI